jgi:penicillin-binding protein 1B
MFRKQKAIFRTPEPRSKAFAWWSYGLLLALCLTLIGTGYFYYFSKEIQNRFASRRWSVPARVFSATVPLYPGQTLAVSTLQQMLERRSYQQGLGKELRAGEYRLSPKSVQVFLRDFHFPGKEILGQRVRFMFERDRLVAIEGAHGTMPFLELEPLDMARLFGASRESRLLINIRQVPRYLVDAVTAIEDHRFFEHPGLDWWGILRAIWADLRAHSIVQGGSTITQQLVKNYFLNPQRTLKRKVVEACMAIILETSFSKEEILEMYLNEIYLGKRGSTAIHGMGEAARYYFGRNVEDLTLAEAATLAGMIQAPNAYAPTRHLQACQERRNAVLKRMLELGIIQSSEYEDACSTPVKVPEATLPLKVSPYFVDYVRQQLQELYSLEVLEREGLTIYTTLQPEIAFAAEKALREGLEVLEQEHPELRRDPVDAPLQALMVVLQPKTGAVLALVGGRDYDASSFNRALYAHRQPGSAFKPFVYLAALDQFYTISWLPDELRSYRANDQTWTPRNYDDRYRGQVTLRQALEESLNAPTVQLALSIGLDKIIETARALGIRSALQPAPSLALGALEVTPLELARAYLTLGNEGQEPYLLTVKEVVTATGEAQQQRHIDMTSVTTASKAYIITNMLEGVIQRGTAKSAKSQGVDFPCAGKTGTTSDYQDAWFVGYTTDLLALVWVGYDDNRSTHLTGASSALLIWARFCNLIRPWMHPQPFRVPPGVVQRYVCSGSGLLATSSCPAKRIEPFLAERVPDQFCGLHTR